MDRVHQARPIARRCSSRLEQHRRIRPTSAVRIPRRTGTASPTDGTRLASQGSMTLPRLLLLQRTVVTAWIGRDESRRALNVMIATLGLVLALPLIIIIAVLIKFTSRGPVLFAQRRIGLDRRGLSNAGGNSRRHSA